VRRRRKNAVLEDGALALATNNGGSTPMPLAAQNTGHSGASAPQAKVEQHEILRLLRERGSR